MKILYVPSNLQLYLASHIQEFDHVKWQAYFKLWFHFVGLNPSVVEGKYCPTLTLESVTPFGLGSYPDRHVGTGSLSITTLCLAWSTLDWGRHVLFWIAPISLFDSYWVADPSPSSNHSYYQFIV